MNEFLTKMVGKELDVYCGGGVSLRGKVLKVEGGVMKMEDEEGRSVYVAVEHVVAVWEDNEDRQKRPGFLSHLK